jgi:hypothetical protein
MTKSIATIYGSRATGPSAEWPEGIYKDETASGANNGTPLQVDWAMQLEALPQRIRMEAHMSPSDLNGIVDTAKDNQTWQALMARLSNTAPPQATAGEICAGMPDVDWADPAVAPNYLDTGELIIDACMCFDKATSKHFLAIIHDNNTLQFVSGPWQYSSSPVLEAAPSISWGTTPDQLMAVCSDGEYLYIAWRQTGGTVRVSQFTVANWTGTEVRTWNTGITPAAKQGTKLCSASDARLGFMIPSASNGIYLGSIVKSGLTVASDNFASYETDFVGAKVVSDGSFIFCIGRDESGDPTMAYALLQAAIYDPTQQTITAMPGFFGAGQNHLAFATSLQRVRDLIVVTTATGNILAYNSGTSTMRELFESLPFTPYDNSLLYGTAMGSDGKNIHLFMVEDDSAGSYGFYSVFKVPIGEFLWEAYVPTVPANLSQARNRIAAWSTLMQYNTPSAYLLFDRRDMWLVMVTGHIYRICNP